MNPRELLIFIFSAILIGLVTLVAVVALKDLPVVSASPPLLIEMFKAAVAALGGFVIKLVYDAIKGRDRMKAARALVLEELKQALSSCDDKISEWDARLQNSIALTISSAVHRLNLYPTIATFAFESVASDLTKLSPEQRSPIFNAYYYVLRRRENSERELRASHLTAHGRDAIIEIRKIRDLIELGIAALKF